MVTETKALSNQIMVLVGGNIRKWNDIDYNNGNNDICNRDFFSVKCLKTFDENDNHLRLVKKSPYVPQQLKQDTKSDK